VGGGTGCLRLTGREGGTRLQKQDSAEGGVAQQPDSFASKLERGGVV